MRSSSSLDSFSSILSSYSSVCFEFCTFGRCTYLFCSSVSDSSIPSSVTGAVPSLESKSVCMDDEEMYLDPVLDYKADDRVFLSDTVISDLLKVIFVNYLLA